MRVADRTSARNYLKYLNDAKTEYAKINERVASGKRFTKISDDVSSGTRVLQTRTDLYKTEKHLSNVKSINEELSVTEDCMDSISTLLNRAHELIVKAKTGTTGDTGRATIAEEIKGLKQELIQFSNTQYGKKFIFGGTNAVTSPFTLNGDGRLQYNGIDVDSIKKDDDGQYYYTPLDSDGKPQLDNNGNEIKKIIPKDGDVYMDIGMGFKMTGANVDPNSGFLVSYSGLDFMGWGTDPETGLSNNIYNILSDIETNIRDYNEEALSKVDDQLTNLTDKFRANLTNIGAKTSYLDTMQDRLTKTVDSYKIKINDLMGTNDAEDATAQSMNDYVLKAIIQMGSRILPVSLMDYLR